ncbi:hypothetical protein B0A79_05300 [Flavobacterium piscis]|uniref:Uncharacterized protein n=1 Tax=Flavobacterium piscis TaxID=1114874 RepID=A0ABX2XNG7_9FLAO|nr:hypothetical protein FLP_06120 [Flavobacterium piscis]OXG06831.1 hypothetical protein B0A79_05300 [Flavobacterium piscis]
MNSFYYFVLVINRREKSLFFTFSKVENFYQIGDSQTLINRNKKISFRFLPVIKTFKYKIY